MTSLTSHYYVRGIVICKCRACQGAWRTAQAKEGVLSRCCACCSLSFSAPLVEHFINTPETIHFAQDSSLTSCERSIRFFVEVEV